MQYNFPDAEDSKQWRQCGEPQLAIHVLEANQVDAGGVFSMTNLKKAEVSNPALITSRDGSQYYKIFLLKNAHNHVANLTDDYQTYSAGCIKS